MDDSVTVTAASRLHLGFLDMNGGLGRRFGSLGLAIDRPATCLTLRRSKTQSATGLDAERALPYLETLRRHFGLAAAYDLTLHEAIPAHSGLGSGTQLALALGAALRRLEGIQRDPIQDAQLLRRGARSGIGLGLFERGGFIVDGGHGARTVTPPVLVRMEFPPQWRVIIVLDPHSEGVHGSAEHAAFAQLPDCPASLAGEICRLVLIQALPALVEQDIDPFGDAITRLQEIAGEYFAPAQGGAPYTSAAVARVIHDLQQQGAKGTGQSSWGPTGFAFAPSAEAAQFMCDAVQARADSEQVKLVVCKGVNYGVLVEGETFTASP